MADLFDGTPYRAIGRLGEGGMGEVYLVEHRSMGRQAVAKVLRARFNNEPRLEDRMRVEAQALGRLQHPHIVSVLGLTRTRDGRPCILMEYLHGRTLTDELAERGHLPVAEAVRYACQLLAALEAAHGIGLVHRDIKPDNLFIGTGPDGQGWLKVLDFGVVRVLPDAPPEAPEPVHLPTEEGVIVGTPRYVSPETVMGQPADPRSDLYAAALVLYKMIAGRGPFDHIESDELLLTAHALEDPEPPSRVAETPVPPELDHLVVRALAKDPGARFQTAQEFSRRLSVVMELLMRPQGWANTSAFDLESGASPPTRGLAPPLNASEKFVTAAARILTERREKVPSKPLMTAVFLLAMLVAAGIALGAVALTRSLW